MKVGVITFPGSNCDDDMMHVFGDVMKMDVSKIWHKASSLDGFTREDLIVLPGGFSYGDYLRAGAVARFSPIMKSVIEFANDGGLVWGICNGFQILCEAGLLPGVLLRNQNQKFIGRNAHIRVETNNSKLTTLCTPGQVLKMPIAHADGRFYADEASLHALKSNDQVLFRYCDARGSVDESTNPNGSVDNIAGICNRERNVVGMMPHPERAAEPILHMTDGLALFSSINVQRAASR